MYIKQNKIIQLEPKRNKELYNLQLKFQHTPVQLNGLVWVEYCTQLCCKDIATKLYVI